ncbi:Vps51p NDAI_0B05030 [Naumovozyma dairenensis CBS 421]|uniref:Uncharacterized protein n=1 Tax=Naumovozyma dairenensis (strain ATCC 10597 / BCRC 20456 / CBS 421 / NBRC 0211 / NRRL Y-12639) TaxID=1071378 RepID=G0W6X5_NAUDC|nr:hypothetical protein NDAI_0B05030 [Naumovozyma dairenensis CBS 421]CCD23536.1 hypothetical protein NDAI_0B05030 [Naumovozyma dairenensis CBS 421]
MAEQISHKKSLRVNRLSKDRRQLLKEYYNLDSDANSQIANPPPTIGDNKADEEVMTSMETIRPMEEGEEGSEEGERRTMKEGDEEGKEEGDRTSSEDAEGRKDRTSGLSGSTSTPLEDKPISDLTFKELIHIHNSLLKRETETNNSIKNTIYDNYYDLIKVNNLLKDVVKQGQGQEIMELKRCIDLLNA